MDKGTVRIILSTGGTGGHIFPALAVASALQAQCAHAELLFVGAQYGKEEELATKAGLKFHGLNVRGLKGRGLRAIPAFFAMMKAIWESFQLLGQVKPDAVIGFGGYACFAVVLAAKLRNIPCLIHEQNAVPGLANKVLARFADTVCLSLPDTKNAFPAKKCVLTGNPIRSDIAKISPQYKEKRKRQEPHKNAHLLIMGGSLGASAINSLAVELLASLRDNGINIIHQCGKNEVARLQEAYLSHGYSKEEIDTMLFAFIDNMADCYAKADLALCRAGATSIAELTATGTPAVFIPFPHATGDHQTANAQNLVDKGAALLFAESELHRVDMKKIIINLLADTKKLHEMGMASHQLAQVNAANVVSEVLLKSIKTK